MVSRQAIEQQGRQNAGILEDDGDQLLVTVLGYIPMYVRKDDQSVTPSLTTYGYWEAWITAWLVSQLSEPGLFLDIGANTGYYSFIASSYGWEVIAFEPNPDYASMIRKSAGLRENVEIEVHEAAVSDSTGTATLIVPAGLQGSATIRDIDLSLYDPRRVEVETVALDHILSNTDKQVIIKIDAEGAEELIWNGSRRYRSTNKPTLMIEYTPNAYTAQFLDELEQYGRLRWINFDGQEEPITREQILLQTDWIMLVIRPKEV